MDSSGPTSTRFRSTVHQEDKKTVQSNFKRSPTIVVTDSKEDDDSSPHSTHPSLSVLSHRRPPNTLKLNLETSSVPNSYSMSFSETQVVVNRSRSRKLSPEYSNERQNTHYQESEKPKHTNKQDQDDGQMPLLALMSQPRDTQPQDLGVEPIILRDKDSSVSKTGRAKRRETARYSETKGGFCVTKYVSHIEDLPLTAHRHTLCNENQPCYPTQRQMGSAFSPARGQRRRPCCHGNDTLLATNIQKYSEPYYFSRYPIVIQKEQVSSPCSDFDTCYRRSQPSFSLTTRDSEERRQPSPKNPIIIDCFSLATKRNQEKIPGISINQELQPRYQYRDDDTRDLLPQVIMKQDQNKFIHNCEICRQITTGELAQICSTSVSENCDKCCYATEEHDSLALASSIQNTKDESSESCWDSAMQNTSQSKELYNSRLPGSPAYVFKQEYDHEKSDESERQETITVREDRTVMNSAFSSPNLHNPDHDRVIYEQDLQVMLRQEDQGNAESEFLTRESLLDVRKQKPSTSSSPKDLYYHSQLTPANTAALYPPDGLGTSTNRKDFQRNWEAMYEVLQGPDKSKKKSYMCNHCGRAFTHLSSLNNHIRTHTGQKPFRCRYCGKRFAQSGVLTAHLRTHTGDKPFKCVICGKRFAQTTTLANHIRTHTGQKPFSCKYCKRTFAQSSTRNKHELSHTKEKPFECKYCGRSFTQSATVMRHMRIHMRDTKYSCVHCGKTFSYLYSLDKHLDAHTT